MSLKRKWDDPGISHFSQAAPSIKKSHTQQEATTSNIAPIFHKSKGTKSGLAQGTWKVFPEELFIFTDSNIECRTKVAGFDMDGTLIRTVSGNVFPKDNDDWQIWSPEVTKEIQRMHNNGFKICIFTNQKGIHLKKISPAGFKVKMQKICARIGVPIQAFVSLGTPNYRKPFVGMWEMLEKSQNGGVTIDRSQCIYVGDAAGRIRTKLRPRPDHSLADRLLALNLGISFMTPEQFFLKKMEDEEYRMPSFRSLELFQRNKQFEPEDAKFPGADVEVVVMVGPPASGKSSLSARLSHEHGYAVVNQDELKTWQNCVKNVTEFLRNRRRVIVDNTNRDVETRMRYVEVARSMGVPCRCVVMKCGVEQACHINLFRKISGLADERHKYVNDVVLKMFFTGFKAPSTTEGFQEIIHAHFVPKFTDETHKRIFSMYLLEKPEK